MFGSALDSNQHVQGWIAHFPDGYLKNLKPTAITAVAHPVTGQTANHFIVSSSTLPYATVTVQAMSDLAAGFSGSIGTATADESGLFSYDDAGAVGLTKRFYRVTLP